MEVIPLHYLPVTDIWGWTRMLVTQLQGEVLQMILRLKGYALHIIVQAGSSLAPLKRRKSANDWVQLNNQHTTDRFNPFRSTT